MDFYINKDDYSRTSRKTASKSPSRQSVDSSRSNTDDTTSTADAVCCPRFLRKKNTKYLHRSLHLNFVACCFDIVAFDNVAATLLLVWTGLNIFIAHIQEGRHRGSRGETPHCRQPCIGSLSTNLQGSISLSHLKRWMCSSGPEFVCPFHPVY